MTSYLVCMCLVTFMVFITSCDESVNQVNITNIIYQYTLVCGYDYLCNKSYFAGLPKPENVYVNNDLCPRCYCDELCLARGNCCPDKFPTNPIYKCISVSLFPNITSAEAKYRMIDYCPETATENEKNKCEHNVQDADRLTSLPVTVMQTLTTYSNRHCANCNGDTDFIQWGLDFKCVEFLDFNFLSSYQEIWDRMYDKKCKVSYSPPAHEIMTSECSNHGTSLPYSKCNITGYWQKYDPDIEWACSKKHYPFRVFKNIFCYICNPATAGNDQVIRTCNVTGRLKQFDQGLWNACLTQPSSEVTFPFKNVFCFLCNMNYSGVGSKLDVKMYSYENFYSNSLTFDYFFTTLQFEKDYFQAKDDRSPSDSDGIIHYVLFSDMIKNFESDIIIQGGNKVNVTELVLNNLAYTAKLPINYHMQKYSPYDLHFITKCNHSDTCIFENSDDCCVDLLIRYPFSCIGNENLSSLNKKFGETFYYMTDQCWRHNVSSQLRAKCGSSDTEDILSTIPLKSVSGIYYKNWYCYVCNEHNLQYWDTPEVYLSTKNNYRLWNLRIECDSYLNYAYYPSVSSVIDVARLQNCKIQFHPKDYGPVCDRDLSLINNCSDTWRDNDSTKWACEYLNHPVFPPINEYKNIFCETCNSDSNILVQKCNETGTWSSSDPIVEIACISLPSVPGSFPFKNKFCELCNPAANPLPKSTTITTVRFGSTTTTTTTTTSNFSLRTPNGGDVNKDVTFRSIFSLTSYDSSESDSDNSAEKCNTNLTVYDPWQDKCRNKTCFPGKLLVNEQCIPLFQVTSNLGYILSFKLEMIHIKSAINVYIVLKAIKEQLLKNVLGDIYDDGTQVVSFYAHANEPCDGILLNTSKNKFSVKLYTHFYIRSYVERLKIEHILQESKNCSYAFIIETDDEAYPLARKNDTVSFQSDADIDSLFSPAMSNFVGADHCALIETGNYESVSSKNYRSVYVSKILLCSQIELAPEEFELDIGKMQLRIKFSNTVFFHDKFQLLPSGKVRICVEDFPNYSSKEHSDIDTLGILTLVCTLTSLCVLFITFISYCLFPVLRTVPGKNNMALVFAIFFSQLILQFGLTKTNIFVFCVAIGLLGHFFWLSMFGCMNICSFHMVRVFRGIYNPMDNRSNKTTLVYISLSYGLPIIIVVTNMTVHLVISTGIDTGYGAGKCFISHKISFIVSFLVPVMIICLLNIIFFVITLYTLKTMPKIQSNKRDRHEVVIYIKLFTLTGILWLLQVVDSFFPRSVFSYLVTVLNGLQGVFIFVSYICNKRVLLLYRNKFIKSKYSVDSTRTVSTGVTHSSARSASDKL